MNRCDGWDGNGKGSKTERAWVQNEAKARKNCSSVLVDCFGNYEIHLLIFAVLFQINVKINHLTFLIVHSEKSLKCVCIFLHEQTSNTLSLLYFCLSLLMKSKLSVYSLYCTSNQNSPATNPSLSVGQPQYCTLD